MHKVILAVLGVFLIVSIVLIITEKENIEEVEILALRESRSLLIANSGDTVTITLYFSVKDTFLTAVANISSCQINDTDETIDLAVRNIIIGDEAKYKGRKYWAYHYELGFSEVFPGEAVIVFEDARIVIAYNNNETIEIGIGALSLCFWDLGQSAHLDFSRLYGTTISEGGTERLESIGIEFVNRALDTVTIIAIETYVEGMTIDVMKGSTADHLEYPEVEGVPISDASLWEFGLDYDDRCFPVYRFPLFITYRYLDDVYWLVIDDFLFFRKIPFFEVDDAIVQSYLYHYQ